MTNPESWSRIKEVALKRRDDSARGLARAVRRETEARQKLDLLIEYRLDYRARFERASRAGIRGETLRNYQKFLANLEQAIAQHTQTVNALQNDVAAARSQVHREQRRADSYEILEERRNSASLAHERRREQKFTDELATRPLPRIAANNES